MQEVHLMCNEYNGLIFKDASHTFLQKSMGGIRPILQHKPDSGINSNNDLNYIIMCTMEDERDVVDNETVFFFFIQLHL